jgi:hypothetical protein
MGARENSVESHLDNEIKKIGGITRKWSKSNVNGVPDRIVIIEGLVYFVELKTVDGRLSSSQDREIKRLMAHGANVYCMYGHSDVDVFIRMVKKLLDIDPVRY